MTPYFTNTREKKVAGIIIVPVPGQEKPAAKKYSYIDNSLRGIGTFTRFAKRKFSAATHINFYANGVYIDRIYLE